MYTQQNPALPPQLETFLEAPLLVTPFLVQHTKTYEHVVGVATHDATLLQPLANWLPMFVLLMATQKTRATRRTINVYSTKPWPSSSTRNLFRSSITCHPLSRAAIEIRLSVEQVTCQVKHSRIFN